MKSHTFFSHEQLFRWIAGAVAAAISAAAFLTALHFQNAQNFIIGPAADNEIHRVVIAGKRMTEQEKLNYDLAPTQIARVEIIGVRS